MRMSFRADGLERHKLIGMPESFARTKYFSSFSYITTKVRLTAKRVEELLPERFGTRTEESYDADVAAANQGEESGKDSRGISRICPLNSIPFFHCAKLGSFPPCVSHDIMQGMFSI